MGFFPWMTRLYLYICSVLVASVVLSAILAQIWTSIHRFLLIFVVILVRGLMNVIVKIRWSSHNRCSRWAWLYVFEVWTHMRVTHVICSQGWSLRLDLLPCYPEDSFYFWNMQTAFICSFFFWLSTLRTVITCLSIVLFFPPGHCMRSGSIGMILCTLVS